MFSSINQLVSKKFQTTTRAATLIAQCRSAKTLLGLHMGKTVFAPLEQLKRSLQSCNASVSGMLAAAAVVRHDLLSKRTDEYFRNILTTVNSACEEFDLNPLALPRHRKVPARYCSVTRACERGVSGHIPAPWLTAHFPTPALRSAPLRSSNFRPRSEVRQN
jgi:hypothetical protein